MVDQQLVRVIGATANTVQAHDQVIRALGARVQQLEAALKGFADQTTRKLKVVESNVVRLNSDVAVLQKRVSPKTDLKRVVEQLRSVKGDVADVINAASKVAAAMRNEEPEEIEVPPAQDEPAQEKVINAEFREEK